MIKLDLINTFFILAAMAYLTLGLFVFLKNKKNKTNLFFFLICLSLIFWSILSVIFRAAPPEQTDLSARLVYSLVTFLVTFFFCFVLNFPRSELIISKKKLILIFLPNFFIFGVAIFPGILIEEVQIFPDKEKVVIFDPLFFYLYFGYFLFYFLYGAKQLFYHYFSSAGILKTQILYVILGTIIPGVGIIFTNLILPGFFGIFDLNWSGPLIALLMPIFFSYAILKHHLLQIKVILAELFALGIILIFFAQLILAKTLNEFFYRLFFLILISLFSLILIRSIFKEIQTKKKLEVAYQELKKLDQAKSEFISIASHQLRTPLAVIKGYLSMLIEESFGKISPPIKQKIENVYQSNERLIKLVNDLLNISRIEAGKMELELKKVQIEEIIDSVIRELEIEAKAKKIELNFKRPAQPFPPILVDSQKIREVIFNIVDNAIRYTNQGGVNLELKISDSRLRIIISDSGEGMEEEELKSIFESFSRGGAGKKAGIKGMGLGLYIAKKFVEMHQGKIWAQSEGKGKGSTFFVELPL